MQAQDVVTLARDLLNESTPGQRWTDAQLIRFTDRAQKVVIRTLKWPESRFVLTTTPNVQEYQIPEVVRMLRVYLNGQPLVFTNIPTLEGQQIQLNDQTGSVGGPGGLVNTGTAPVLAGGQYTPQWTSQPAASYPVASALTAPSPAAQPWIVGQRPRCYMRGGMIGLVPAPLGAYPLVMDCIAQPATLENLSDTLVLPDIALDLLAWGVAEFCYYADPQNQGAGDSRNYATAEKQKALADVKAWKREYDGVGPKGPNILPLRMFYTSGQHRIGNC